MRAFADSQVDLADVQGNILRGYNYPYAAYAFVHIADAPAGRRWVSGLLERVTTAERWPAKPATTLNLAFTYAGLEALGVAAEDLAAFAPEFADGMAARADELGDRDEDAPERWDAGLGTGAAHALVTVNALEQAELDRVVDELRAGLDGTSLSLVAEQAAAMLTGAREHFGFADGFSQPAVEGDGNVALPGHGTPEKDGRWSELLLGEFLTGYVDQDQQLPFAPSGPLGKNGAYMIYRKLRQDVAAFRRALREHAAGFPGGEQRLAAKIMGRWPNGTPTLRSPDAPDQGFDRRAPDANDFRYEDDPLGAGCPLGAHVRRANPRDALGWHGTRTRRHRMIRRGMPYGPPLPDGVLEDDGEDRGLVFVSFCASPRRQFEIVNAQWLGDGNLFGLGDDRDWMLLHDDRRLAKMTIQGKPPRLLAGQPRFVTVRGGEYLLAPSIAGLRSLGA